MREQKHVYDYDIDLTSDTAPARVIRMVRRGSKVLEIGAGPGSITRHMANTLGCDVDALEVDPSAIEVLKSYGLNAYPGDLNNAGWSQEIAAKRGKFDFVIAADVLEHVLDPWAVLGEMKSLLNEGGQIILSIPHVGHAAVVACLLDEDFEYGPWGLLDRTHVRFFGIKNMQALINGAGLVIEQAEFVVRTPEMTEFVSRWERIPSDVQAAIQRNRFSHVLQAVVRLRPGAAGERGIDLLTQTPVPPDQDTFDIWNRVMRYHAATRVVDQRSPIRDSAVEVVNRDASATANTEDDSGDSVRDVRGVRAVTVDSKDVRLVAFYLPQFHPFPENDEWWGKGFTEWTNVARAKPLYVGHYQPHLPSDLGFYDLRVPEVRRQQAAMAKGYGIDAFCYHYYWFSGKRLMERPLDEMLADPQMDMPFCLCWANENWSRRWDGQDHELLIKQDYRPEDPVESLRSMLTYLQDRRYLTHKGRKVILVYFPQSLPNSAAWAEAWRVEARALGLGELHLVCALTHGNWSYKAMGFDAGVEFPPHNLKPEINAHLHKAGFFNNFGGVLADMKDVAEGYLNRDRGDEPNVHRAVYPSWDNTARRKDRAVITLNGTPENYEYWLHRAIQETRRETGGKDGLVFINAWNEWAEGCHLEPDHRYGHAFLEATLRAKRGSALTGWTHVGIPEDADVPAQERYVSAATKLVKVKPKKRTGARRAVLAVRDALRVVRGKKAR